MSSTNMRTIWLTLRATNYTAAVFEGVTREISGMAKTQMQMNIQMMSLGKSAMAMGMMFSVLGSQIGGVGGRMLSLTGEFMITVGAMSMAMGVIKTLSSAEMANKITIDGCTISYRQLGMAVAGAFMSFMLVSQLMQGMSGPASAVIAIVLAVATAFWILYVAANAAWSTVTLGIAGILGGAAAAAAWATAQSYMGQTSNFQMGTRQAGYTGLAMIHQNEVIYNPATGRPTQIGNELAGGMGGGTTHIDASMHVGTLNTKMDTEELNNAVKKQGRRIAYDRR